MQYLGRVNAEHRVEKTLQIKVWGDEMLLHDSITETKY